MPMEILSTTTVTARGGVLHRVKHASTSINTPMIFAIFLPSSYSIWIGKGTMPAICEWSSKKTKYDRGIMIASY